MRKTRLLVRWVPTIVILLALLPSSTFAEDWLRRRTAVHRPRTQLGRAIFNELESLLRDRYRGARPRPESWPDEPRRPPASRRGARDGDLVMPVANVRWEQLRDSFGDPRSGGRRHRGIDIFAPRWTEVVAATSGMLTAIGQGGLAGRSLWLVGTDGRSYFYGHLEAWARDVYDGLRVGPAELIGYVGNSGNAARTPTHLHFEVHEDGRVVNPYAVLADAAPVHGTRRIAGLR